MNQARNQRLIRNPFSCSDPLNADHVVLRQAYINSAILLEGVLSRRLQLV